MAHVFENANFSRRCYFFLTMQFFPFNADFSPRFQFFPFAPFFPTSAWTLFSSNLLKCRMFLPMVVKLQFLSFLRDACDICGLVLYQSAFLGCNRWKKFRFGDIRTQKRKVFWLKKNFRLGRSFLQGVKGRVTNVQIGRTQL